MCGLAEAAPPRGLRSCWGGGVVALEAGGRHLGRGSAHPHQCLPLRGSQGEALGGRSGSAWSCGSDPGEGARRAPSWRRRPLQLRPWLPRRRAGPRGKARCPTPPPPRVDTRGGLGGPGRRLSSVSPRARQVHQTDGVSEATAG